MSRIIARLALVAWAVALSAGTAAAQGEAAPRDSIYDSAAQLLDQGRVDEARILLLRAMRESNEPSQKAEYRLRIGAAFLYDGQYDQAARAYNAVLAHASDGPLARDAHHGLALVDAFAGRSARAATQYAQALGGGGTLRDTIEMLVMTNQNDSAQKALDRLAASSSSPANRQFVQVFRSLSWLMAGHCTEALPELAKAPQQDQPIPVAIRGRCAMKHGQRPQGLAFKNAVLTQPAGDPFAWTTLIARDAARKIE